MFFQIADNKFSVFCKICILFIYPFIPICITGFNGTVCHAVRAHKPCLAKGVFLDLLVLRIWNNGTGRMKTCHVKSLADRGVDQHMIVHISETCSRSILMSVKDYISMDLIREQPYGIFLTQFYDISDLIFCPYTAYRVVGVAEDHGLYITTG